MSTDACDLNVHPVTGLVGVESVLHKQLINDYPSAVVNGTSKYYELITTDPNFLSPEGFGEWTNSTIYKLMLDYNIMESFNEQGEPRLYSDVLNNPYVISPKGDIIWLVNKNRFLTPTQLQEITNTLAGDYVSTTPISIDDSISDKKAVQSRSVVAFVKNKIETRINKLNKELDFFKNERDTTSDRSYKKELRANIGATAKKITILNNILGKGESSTEGSPILDLITKRVNAKLTSSNFKIRESVSDKENDDTLLKHEEIKNFTIESNQVSNRSADDIVILKFLASIPKFNKYHEDIETQMAETNMVENTLLGGPLYENPRGIRTLIEDNLANVINPSGKLEDIFDRYVNILEREAIDGDHAALNYIAHFLKNIDKSMSENEALNFKTKFFSSMYKGKNTFIINIIKEEDNGRKKVELVDPANTYSKESKITSKFIETIINRAESRNDITVARKEALEMFKDEVIQNPTFENYNKLLNKLLIEDLGLNLNRNTISKFIKENSYNGFTKLNSYIRAFLQNDIRSKAITDLFAENNKVDGELDLVRELKNSSKEKEAETIKKFLMRDNTFLRKLAKAESIYKNDVAENTLRTGNTQRWVYSYMSNIQLTLLKLKEDSTEFMHRNAGKNFTYVDFIAANPESLDNIKLVINTEIKKEYDSNPVLHKNITEADLHKDILVKMFNSRDEFYEEYTSKRKDVDAMEAQAEAKLKNYIVYNAAADKNSILALTGLPTPINVKDGSTGNMYNVGDKKIAKDFERILNGYVRGEFDRMKKDSQKVATYLKIENPVEKQDYLMKNLIQDYHFKLSKTKEDGLFKDLSDPKNEVTEEEFKEGNYHKLGVFTKVFNDFLNTDSNTQNVYVSNDSDTKIAPILEGSFVGSKKYNELMKAIYSEVNDIIQKNYEYLDNILATRKEVIDKDGNVEFVEENLFDIETNINVGDKDTTIYNYIIGSFIAVYEFTGMFNGHISYYKQSNNLDQVLNDFVKRAHAPSANGNALYQNNTVENTDSYVPLSEARKPFDERTSIPYDRNRKSVAAVVNSIDNLQSRYAESISKTRKGKVLNYGGEIADAQSYATPKYFRKVLTNLYGWTDYDSMIYDRLNDRNYQVTDEDIRWLKTSKANTPLKLVHFELTEEGLPIYFKYSVAPLFDAIVAGSEVAKLKEQMEAQGVDKVVFKSGSKGSNMIPTTIHTMDGKSFNGLKNDILLNPFLISDEYTLLQTVVPTKLDNSIVMGNQAIKNIMSNLDLDSTDKNYFFRDKAYTAKEVYEMITDTTKEILQTQLNRTLNDLGFDRVTLQFNNRNIKNFLIGQMDLETEMDVLKLLRTDLPLETIPNFAQRAYPVLASFIHDNAGKVYTNGASVVQVANIGFDRLSQKSADGVFFFNDEVRDLTPPKPITYKDLNSKDKKILGKQDSDTIIYYREDGTVTLNESEKDEDGNTIKNKMRINKPKILIPFASIFSKGHLSYEEFIELYKKGKIDERILKNLIGYRIPNQALSSNDSFEIIGILPPIAGDQAIMYHEITAKTGSDFDIDKLYLMLASFSTPKAKHNIPEEMKEVLKELVKIPGFKERQLWEFSSIPHLKDFSGNDILQEFIKNKEILDLLNKDRLRTDKKGIKLHQRVDRPIGIILDNYEEIRNILDRAPENDEVDHYKYGDQLIYLTTVLDDLKQSHNAQAEYINSFYTPEIKKEISIKKAKFYQKYGEVINKEFNYIDDDSYHGQKNKLIELFGSILESQESYDDLMSPLDNPIIKETIHKIIYLKAHPDNQTPTKDEIDKYINDIAPSGLEQMFPVGLVSTRVDVLEAKSLISIMANNMSDLGYSQKADFRLKYPIGFGKSPTFSRIYQLETQEQLDKKQTNTNSETKLTKIISYLMNSAVDAAKDDYIIQGNFNTYTANAAMMITRLGVNTQDVFTILMNDTILEISKERSNATAKIADITPEIKQDELDQLARNFLVELSETKTENVFDIISREDFLTDNVEKEDLIRGFWHLLSELGKEFNNSVLATKTDSNGPGINIAEMVAYTNRLRRLEHDVTLNSEKKLFLDGLTDENLKFNPNIKDNVNATYLGVLANNSLFLMRDLSKQIFIEASDAAIEAVNKMSAAFGNPLPTNADDIKLNYNYLYPSLLIQTGNSIYNISETREAWLLEEFPKALQQYKDSLPESNLFLDELIIDSKEGNILFPRTKEYSPEDRMLFKEAINEIMNDGKINNIDIMDSLVQYAFLTSGFKSTLTSYHDLIPANYFVNKGHGTSVKSFTDKYNIMQEKIEGTESVTIRRNHLPIEDSMTLIAMNNHNSYKVVKKVSNKDGIHNNIEVTKDTTLDKITTYTDLEGNKSFYPFVKRGKTLFMLTEVNDNIPIYQSIETIDTTDKRLYSFNNLDRSKNLLLQNVEYVSKSSKLYKDIYGEVTQEMWDSMSKEEQNKFNECR